MQPVALPGCIVQTDYATNPKRKMNVVMKYEALGKKIKNKRESLGITREALSKTLGVSTTAIQNWENGLVKPKYERAKALSGALDIDMAELLDDQSYKQPPRSIIPVAPPPAQRTEIPMPDFGAVGVDPFIQAMSDIKEIFDSGDPILIPAIQANLNAFKRALLREKQFAQILKENRELNDRIAKQDDRILELEKKINYLTGEHEGSSAGAA